MSVEYCYLSLPDLNYSLIMAPHLKDKENFKGVRSMTNLQKSVPTLDSGKNPLGKSPPSLRGPQ